jgi:ABC-2 type transport system permease protein
VRKLFAVLKREYLQAVKKKSFLIMTILFPFLMAALMYIPSLLAMRGAGDRRIAVLDATGRLEAGIRERLEKKGPEKKKPEEKTPADAARKKVGLGDGKEEGVGGIEIEYAAIPATADLKASAKPWLDRLRAKDDDPTRKIDGVLLVPAGVFDDPAAKMTYFTRSSTDIITQQRLGRAVGRSVSHQRLTARGLDPKDIESLLREVDIENVQMSKSGEEKKGGELTFLVGLLFVVLLFMPMMIYGQEILRGVIQEKNERIVEILISSMTPMQLLTGKVTGLAAVSMTQLLIWGVMGGLMAGWAGGLAMMAGVDLSSLVRLDSMIWFVVFYILGYMIFICIFAVGGAIVNSEKEAQQFMGPINMLMIVPWILWFPIMTNPESTLATILSLIPVYTPMTMFMRVLVSEPPAWQLALSVVLSIGTIWGLFWATAKIFRVGILSYGKRPTVPELVRWLRRA